MITNVYTILWERETESSDWNLDKTKTSASLVSSLAKIRHLCLTGSYWDHRQRQKLFCVSYKLQFILNWSLIVWGQVHMPLMVRGWVLLELIDARFFQEQYVSPKLVATWTFIFAISFTGIFFFFTTTLLSTLLTLAVRRNKVAFNQCTNSAGDWDFFLSHARNKIGISCFLSFHPLLELWWSITLAHSTPPKCDLPEAEISPCGWAVKYDPHHTQGERPSWPVCRLYSSALWGCLMESRSPYPCTLTSTRLTASCEDTQ